MVNRPLYGVFAGTAHSPETIRRFTNKRLTRKDIFGSALYSYAYNTLHKYANTINLGTAKLSLMQIAVPHTSYMHHAHSWTWKMWLVWRTACGPPHNLADLHTTKQHSSLYKDKTIVLSLFNDRIHRGYTGNVVFSHIPQRGMGTIFLEVLYSPHCHCKIPIKYISMLNIRYLRNTFREWN